MVRDLSSQAEDVIESPFVLEIMGQSGFSKIPPSVLQSLNDPTVSFFFPPFGGNRREVSRDMAVATCWLTHELQ